MITGVHAIMFSPAAEQVREFLSGTLGLGSVDAGAGWPVFALPPAELALHPGADKHELYLMCDDIAATMRELRERGVETGDVADRGWGLLSSLKLPGGGELGLYEPKHPTPR